MPIVSSLSAEIAKIRTSRFARNAGWMFAGQGLSLVLQAGYFIFLARLLGVKEYGIFAGAFAFVGIAMPYSTIGAGTVFMRHVGARPGEFSSYWGNILLSTAVGGGGLIALLSILAPLLLNPASASIVIYVAIANCIFNQLVNCIGQVFQTFELLRITAFLSILTNALRTATAAAMWWILPRATAAQWAIASMAISSAAALIGIVLVSSRFGRPRFSAGLTLSSLPEGVGFSIGGSAQSVYNDVDKAMLSHFGLNQQNGIYTMAYRVVDIATIPVTAMDSAALPRFFRIAGENVQGVPPLAFRLAKRAFIVALFVAGVLFLSAPVLPLIVGHSFAESVIALRWLCLIPVFRAMHQLTGSAITGMGFQRFRTGAQFTAAGCNFLLNLFLIPRYGWLAAAWVSLATDGSLVLINALIISRLRHR